jgi:hypothetical protein
VDPGKRMGILEKGKTLDSAGNRNPDYPARDLKNAILSMLPRVFTSDDSQNRKLLSQMTEGSSMGVSLTPPPPPPLPPPSPPPPPPPPPPRLLLLLLLVLLLIIIIIKCN